jgi:hypothetical protein
MLGVAEEIPEDGGPPFSTWLREHGQTARAIERFWKVVLVSALNEELDRISAKYAALVFREFKPRTGSAPLVRFLLGMFSVIGALVFLGCPWRAYLRLSAGDGNAIFGILGLAAGICVGIAFLRMGFSLGRNHSAPRALGWVMPCVMIALLLLLLFAPQFGRNPDGTPAGPIFLSTQGPGSQHAPIVISLGVGDPDPPKQAIKAVGETHDHGDARDVALALGARQAQGLVRDRSVGAFLDGGDGE